MVIKCLDCGYTHSYTHTRSPKICKVIFDLSVSVADGIYTDCGLEIFESFITGFVFTRFGEFLWLFIVKWNRIESTIVFQLNIYVLFDI